MNVLVLDDDPAVCAVFKSRLEQEGFICMTASKVTEAWTKARILRFDVLIADIMLGGETPGDVFATEFKKRNPWTKIFFITGSEGAQYDKSIAERVFLKPVDFDELIPAVVSTPQARPREVSGVMKLDDRDSMVIMELVNKVVEHTNIVASTQAIMTESLEELANAMERNEEKLNYIYEMLKKVDDSGILKIYKAVAGFFREAAGKIFWAVVVLIGMWLLRGPLLEFLNKVLTK